MNLEPFAGLMSDANPMLLPPGATQEQVNIRNQIPGQLDGRRGNRLIAFANAAAQVTSDIIGLTGFKRPEAQWVLMVLADGKVRAGRGPT